MADQFSFVSLLENPLFRAQVDWQRRAYAEGAKILEEGGTSGRVYCVLKGRVNVVTEIRVLVDETRKTGFARLSEGQIFGEMSLFDQRPASADVVAASDCEIAEIDGALFNRFMDEHPDYGYRILRHLVTALVARLRANNVRTSSVLDFYLRENQD